MENLNPYYRRDERYKRRILSLVKHSFFPMSIRKISKKIKKTRQYTSFLVRRLSIDGQVKIIHFGRISFVKTLDNLSDL